MYYSVLFYNIITAKIQISREITDMKARQKITKKIVALLLALTVVAGTATTPCDAAEAALQTSEDVITITPEENEETDGQTDQSGEGSEESIEQPKQIKLVHPASFQVTAVKNGVKLSWKESEGAQKYEVYRKESGADAYTLIKTTKNLTYTDKTAEYGVTYIYKVRAIAVSEGKTYKSVCSLKKRCCTYFIDPAKPMVALTFDDGPSQYTSGILDTLEKYESRATFFEVGNRVNWYPETVLRIDQMGCEIGNHSYDHALLGNASASKIRSEISTTDAKIKAITGKTPTLLRPPYGSIGSSLRNNAGKPMILWSIDTLDWQSRNADKVYQSVMSQVSDGDIILMHDIYQSTQTAVARIVPELKKRGYQLVTVSELAQYKNVKLSAGKSYSQI